MHIGSELIAEFHQVVFFFLSFSLPSLSCHQHHHHHCHPHTPPALPPPPSLPYPPSSCFKKMELLSWAGFQLDFFTLLGREKKREKSSSPGRLLNRLNTPPFPSFFLPLPFDNKRENLKNSQCFRLTILIGDRSEKINSLMSRAVSLIKVLLRRWGGTLAEPGERDTDTEEER